jgi:hypothetical protein
LRNLTVFTNQLRAASAYVASAVAAAAVNPPKMAVTGALQTIMAVYKSAAKTISLPTQRNSTAHKKAVLYSLGPVRRKKRAKLKNVKLIKPLPTPNQKNQGATVYTTPPHSRQKNVSNNSLRKSGPITGCHIPHRQSQVSNLRDIVFNMGVP